MALHADKARLSEELVAARTALDQSTELRAQLDEVTKDRDRAKASHFQTEFELERVHMALEESRNWNCANASLRLSFVNGVHLKVHSSPICR